MGTQRAQPATDRAELDEALEVLKRMSTFLASRNGLGFRASIQYDAVQASGQKIEFGSERRILLGRPGRARVEVSHWDGEEELLIFDGTQLSVALFHERVFSSVRFEGTTAEALDYLTTEYGVATPLADLLREDFPETVAERALSGRRLDAVTLGGVRCDHLAFHGERVDFQLFVRQGGAPVPMRVVIDYHAEPGAPQFRGQLASWDVETSHPDARFHFVPRAGAQRVSYTELLDLLLGPLDSGETEQ